MNIAKTRRQAHFFLLCAIAAIACVLLYLFQSVLSVDFSLLSPASFLLSGPTALFAGLCIYHALLLLRTVAKSESPFLPRTVRHLAWIGWLFVAYEPAAFLCQVITNRFFPITFGNGIRMTTTSSYGGVFLICGFVILTVATIFRYGMELQQLSDETI